MGCGGRSSRMIFCVVRRFNSKIVAHSNPIQEFRTFSWRSSLGEATNLGKRVKNSPFVDGAMRFYSSSNNRVHQLTARRRRPWKRWIWRVESSVIWALFASAAACFIYNGSWDTVPYTKRRQLLLRRASVDEEAAEKFESMKKDLTGIIVPPLYPDSVRVQTIARNMVEGDARIKKRWEAFVVKDPAHALVSSHCGKIAFLGGNDAEIAAFIAPTVGRVVANHDLEKHSMVLLLPFIFIVILHELSTRIISKVSLQKFFMFPLSRSLSYFVVLMEVSRLLNKIYSIKMDLEADYIGLMLVASAGYDPRVALRVREKMGSIEGGSCWEKIRARRLILHMEEAISVHSKVWAGCV